MRAMKNMKEGKGVSGARPTDMTRGNYTGNYDLIKGVRWPWTKLLVHLVGGHECTVSGPICDKFAAKRPLLLEKVAATPRREGVLGARSSL